MDTKLAYLNCSLLTCVTYLGHVITAEPKSLSPKSIEAMTFLGITSHCGQWIPNYSEREAPLSFMIHGKILCAHDRLTNETEKALTDLKRTLLLLLVCQKPEMPLFSLLKVS